MDKHHSIKLEKALLGLILVNPSSINKIRGFIIANDFFDQKNRIIFSAFIDMMDEGSEIETTLLIHRLEKNNNLKKIGGDLYISELIESAGMESNITKYIKEIADKSQLRKVKKVVGEIQAEIDKSSADASVILEQVEQGILSATRDTKQKDFEDAKSVVDSSLKRIEERASQEGISGLVTEIPSLDVMTSGLQKGDLIIIAARPSMGKTAFALNLAANVSKLNTVAFFSLEMPAEQLMNRILSFTGFIDGHKLKDSNKLTSDDWKKLYVASSKAKNLNLYIDDSAGVKLAELVWKAKKLAKNVGLDMIVIDYMQLITVGSGSSDNRQAEVSAISRTLKMLARELEIPVIALSQLSRKVEQRENKTPMMSDLRESGAIEQDADIIMFLYREVYYNKEERNKKHQGTDVIIAKHRNGAIGTIKLSFNPTIGLFTDTGKEIS